MNESSGDSSSSEESNADKDLPLPRSPLSRLRASTIALACRLDALLAHLEDEQGYADLHISIKRGIPTLLNVERSYKL